MSNNTMENTIRKNEVFASLTDQELSFLLKIATRRSFSKNELVFDAARNASYMYIVETGSFLLHTLSNNYRTLYPGDLFGEIGIINSNLRTGSVWASEPSSALAICGTSLLNEKYVPAKLALKVVMALSRKITNYLRTREQIATLELIRRGESDFVEFKSTLRWNLHTNKKDNSMQLAVLKTLAAFMNSSGGTLIIGVADDGGILGIETDRFENIDKMLVHLSTLINERISQLHNQFLHPSVELLEGKMILRIDCQPANIPAYVADNNLEHFYIRTGPATIDLRLGKIHEYICRRFENRYPAFSNSTNHQNT